MEGSASEKVAVRSPHLLHHLIFFSNANSPKKAALKYRQDSLSYSELSEQSLRFAQALADHGIPRQERVAIFLEKRFEFVVACFGSSCAGNIFVPVNPILKPAQVLHILNDSGAKVFVTSAERYETVRASIWSTTAVEVVVVVDAENVVLTLRDRESVLTWSSWMQREVSVDSLLANPEYSLRPMVDTDAVSILYTSGSTGRPKGVVLSHRNMVFGAKSVSSYLENNSDDTLLAALPLSFDAGFSQLTTAFFSGARAVLINFILPNDILKAVVKERVTGLTAVPPLWIQIAGLNWPQSVTEHLRYFANTGGRLPLEVLKQLRKHFPVAKPFLMYGLTESFRSTFLPPAEVDKRPDSIGMAIPNAEILVLRPDGSPCATGELGELVHRGALVGLGYWNDATKTAERYKVLPASSGCRPAEIVIPELAVFSGDIVRRDEAGFIYFIGRNDEMMKTSGYRVSPIEVEEIIYDSGVATEVAAFGIPDESLGQCIVVSILPSQDYFEKHSEIQRVILNHCKEKMPTYMVPKEIVISVESHPRNQNGKIDRKLIGQRYLERGRVLPV